MIFNITHTSTTHNLFNLPYTTIGHQSRTNIKTYMQQVTTTNQTQTFFRPTASFNNGIRNHLLDRLVKTHLANMGCWARLTNRRHLDLASGQVPPCKSVVVDMTKTPDRFQARMRVRISASVWKSYWAVWYIFSIRRKLHIFWNPATNN